MPELILRGDWESALSHLALFGAAAILEDAGDHEVRVHWQATMAPQPTLTTRFTSTEVGQVIRQHARNAANGWVGQTFSNQGRMTGTLSPRMTAPASTEAWQALQQAREELTRDASLSRLDQRMIASLGEPGYWCYTAKREARPDWSASPWEMKTRNRGEEFVQNRLAKLARSVGARTESDVLAGLTGALVRDEAGKDAIDSRTPTGLTPPRRTDNALAWCALWGIAQTTVRPRTRTQSPASNFQNRSYASGVVRWKGRTVMALPVFDRPTRMAVLRGVLRGDQLQRVAAVNVDDAWPELITDDAIQWLASRGCGAIMTFNQFVSDNTKAPEQWLQGGRRVPLRS
ncbi:hypothetical protein [Enemella evansiae]|uniref:hypothetical protein n=1 Tax=Enemella evansiae TaxID=2016499 RepID=UPI00117CFC8D|nr:hypothetical protein [Enemella evansiae]